MKNSKDSKIDATYQKNKKKINDSGNCHTDNKVSNDETRSLNENSYILEQVLSDMAWYG
ncbi:hypothetical protein MNBD_GAMMA17-1566 [hydrothermal vent metagenome]|uniref:Uncharacterized protein n=1 Tax=hydrothermal vent metagenome TaxID=652676 RepID=A0A3B0ZBB6_9ZZZZ